MGHVRTGAVDAGSARAFIMHRGIRMLDRTAQDFDINVYVPSSKAAGNKSTSGTHSNQSHRRRNLLELGSCKRCMRMVYRTAQHRGHYTPCSIFKAACRDIIRRSDPLIGKLGGEMIGFTRRDQSVRLPAATFRKGCNPHLQQRTACNR